MSCLSELMLSNWFGLPFLSIQFSLLVFFQPDDVEEGEIVVSGDSHMDHQQSGSWNHDRDEGEDEQVLQPKIKRKRSLRVRPRHTMERPEEKSGSETPSLQRGDSSLLPFQADHKSQTQSRADSEIKTYGDPHALKHDQSDSSSKTRRSLPARRVGNASKLHASPKSGRSNSVPDPAEDAAEHHRENWDGKVGSTSGTPVYGTKMPDIIQRRVCTVELSYYCFVLGFEVLNAALICCYICHKASASCFIQDLWKHHLLIYIARRVVTCKCNCVDLYSLHSFFFFLRV